MTEKRYKLFEHNECDYILDNPNESLDFIEMLGDALSSEEIVDRLNEQSETIQQLKQDNLIFFQAVFDILLKYQDLFNREMADEVLEELGIELTRWFE